MSTNMVQCSSRAVHAARGIALRPVASQTRSFSASPANQSRIIEFPETKNAELNQLLQEINEKIVLPAQLPPDQRKKINRSRWKTKLEQEPIEMEINEKKYQIKYLDARHGDVPSARKTMWKAMDLMKTGDEWRILPKVVLALSSARKIHNDTWVSLIRRAANAGHMGAIFELAKRPLKNGLALNSHEKVQHFMTGVIRHVASKQWTEAACLMGVRDLEKILRTLPLEGHRPHRGNWTDMAHDPTFLAQSMTFLAVLVQQHGKTEHLPRLQEYVDEILARWPADKGLLTIYPDSEYLKEGGGAHWLLDYSKFVLVAAPILKGFEAAEKVLDGTRAVELEKRRKIVGREKTDAVDLLLKREAESEGKYIYKESAGAEMMRLCFTQEKAKARKEEKKKPTPTPTPTPMAKTTTETAGKQQAMAAA